MVGIFNDMHIAKFVRNIEGKLYHSVYVQRHPDMIGHCETAGFIGMMICVSMQDPYLLP